jgi:GAF domain-containing protein
VYCEFKRVITFYFLFFFLSKIFNICETMGYGILMNEVLPASIAQVFALAQTPEALFAVLMPALGEFLECDRCFIYLRDPKTQMGRVPFCWVRDASVPRIYDTDWKLEQKSLPLEDPMFAAALRTSPSITVNDVETAGPQVLNLRFEQENFGHRALIHAHLCKDQLLWGVLQPCVFNAPRYWSTEEQRCVDQVVRLIMPHAVDYVEMHKPINTYV